MLQVSMTVAERPQWAVQVVPIAGQPLPVHPDQADMFSFIPAPYGASDLGAADRLAQDQRVGPSDLPDDGRLSRILRDVASREGLSGRKIACA
jgi:hypothetical protein